MKKRLLFIGFSFHEKTKSADFMIELLNDQFEVQVCNVDLFIRDPFNALEFFAGHYDVLVCWQVMPTAEALMRQITFKHGVLFPMADGCPNVKKTEKWFRFRNFQIVCFSKQLHVQLTTAGFSSHYFQYFPEPKPVEDWGNPNSAFFWIRRQEVNCELVEYITRCIPVNHIHVHQAVDPGTSYTPPESKDNIGYTFSNWMPKKEELTRIMSESSLYIAPRLKEGIGMSFLDAMAMGRCVIAVNHTTMNEYITHGVNGLLFELHPKSPISSADIRKLQKNAHETIKQGHLRWQRDQPRLIELIQEKPAMRKMSMLLCMIKRGFKNPYKVLRSVMQERNMY